MRIGSDLPVEGNHTAFEQRSQVLRDAWSRQLAQADMELLGGLQAVTAPAPSRRDKAAPGVSPLALAAFEPVQARTAAHMAAQGQASHPGASPQALATAGAGTDDAPAVASAKCAVAKPDGMAERASNVDQVATAPAQMAVHGAQLAPQGEPTAVVVQHDTALGTNLRQVLSFNAPVAALTANTPVMADVASNLVVKAVQPLGLALPATHSRLANAPQGESAEAMLAPQGGKQATDDWQKQHMHLIEDESGRVQLWIRDSAIDDAQQQTIVQRIQAELRQAGLWLASATINGRTAFESRRTGNDRTEPADDQEAAAMAAPQAAYQSGTLSMPQQTSKR
ncbi:hypothetical protein [Chitinimonas sp. JJ19]|uniref:hypothetical protein n=1 Tax=Chitinimonas sp. JJ19 TaxID=3109352 RepID=UPI0030030DD3